MAEERRSPGRVTPIASAVVVLTTVAKLLSVSTGISLIGVPSSTFTTIAAVCLPSRV